MLLPKHETVHLIEECASTARNAYQCKVQQLGRNEHQNDWINRRVPQSYIDGQENNILYAGKIFMVLQPITKRISNNIR